jgi:ABC-type branched-subunit amino acid transport system substrate-binding protein
LKLFAERILSDSSVIACLGGIFSEDARDLTSNFKNTNMPCVLFSATASDLTTENGNVFQMNIPFPARGEMLAHFAKSGLGAKSVIVVSSRAAFAKGMADAFINACKSMKIPVSQKLFYSEDEPELRAKLDEMLNNATFDIDGVVLFHAAGSSREAETLLRELTTLLLPVKLLGAGDYNDPVMLSHFADYPDTLFFESDFAPDSANTEFASFLKEFHKDGRAISPKNALFGYDAANMILEAIKAGNSRREMILKALQIPYIGLRSTIRFSLSCQNNALTVLRYYRGKLQSMSLATE